MSDRLTEVIYQAAFDRNVLIDRTDCEALAEAARAFIANEIHERCDWVDGTGELDDGEVYQKWGIEQAESIARGDTK